jgi:hypothetical protein
MQITESQLRKIVRKELKRLSEITVNDGEGSATSHPLPNGGGLPDYSKEVLYNVWQSSAMDWTLTIIGAATDFMGPAGVAVSVAVAGIATLKSSLAKDWLGAFFSMISAIPAVGDATSILARAAKAGKAVGTSVLKKILLFITKISDSWIQNQLLSLMNSLKDKVQNIQTLNVQEAVTNIVNSKNQFANSLQQTIAQIESGQLQPATQPAYQITGIGRK